MIDLETAKAEIKRLRGTLGYIVEQAKAGHPGALSVIRANAEAALDDRWQTTVKAALAATAEVPETRLPPADSGQVNVFDPRRP